MASIFLRLHVPTGSLLVFTKNLPHMSKSVTVVYLIIIAMNLCQKLMIETMTKFFNITSEPESNSALIRLKVVTQLEGLYHTFLLNIMNEYFLIQNIYRSILSSGHAFIFRENFNRQMIQCLSELIPEFVTCLLSSLECCFLLRGCCLVVVWLLFS